MVLLPVLETWNQKNWDKWGARRDGQKQQNSYSAKLLGNQKSVLELLIRIPVEKIIKIINTHKKVLSRCFDKVHIKNYGTCLALVSVCMTLPTSPWVHYTKY